MTGSAHEQDEQLSLPGLVRAEARKAKPPAEKKAVPAAEVDPVAQVLVDVPLAHLDRAFDYLVPATMAAEAVPGARVKVRFAGQDVDGFVLARVPDSNHRGRLQALRRVVSAEPVLVREVTDLVAAVAARYVGTRSDVLRLAIPPRHATVEKEPSPQSPAWSARPDRDVVADYPSGPDLIDGLAASASPRAVLSVAPGDDWAALVAESVVATRTSGRGALVCVPDRRDLDRLEAALVSRIGPGHHVVLTADAGPAKRYAAFLAVARGAVRIVLGTRAAAFAPVQDLGLVALWDDGDDLFDEPRAPYPHTREVLLLRAQQAGCAALLAAHARSVEAEYLVRSGWAVDVAVPRAALRERLRVSVTGESEVGLARDAAPGARLPGEVFDVLRAGLAEGPVLVQTPRAGYATRLACDRCRTPATCTQCQGPLRVRSAGAPPECRWCGTQAPGWHCPECGGRGLRAPVLGDSRTAEELGRAFPSIPVRTSSAGRVLSEVPEKPSIVVSTPGAEPPAVGGYAAVVMLDTWLLLARSDLRAAEEAVRRWSNAAALVRPGGRAILVGDHAHPALQALVRWDAAGFARREIDERRTAHLPPASRVATLTAEPAVLEGAVAGVTLPAGAEVLGPVPVEVAPGATAGATAGAKAGETSREKPGVDVRLVIRVPRASGAALSEALVGMQERRSARKEPHVRVQVDPIELG